MLGICLIQNHFLNGLVKLQKSKITSPFLGLGAWRLLSLLRWGD